MKHVLVLAGYAKSLLGFRRPLLDRLVREGARVSVAAPDITPEIEARLRALGVEPHEVPISRTGLNPIADVRSLLALRSLMRQLRPDIFLGYTIKPVVYGLLAAKLAGVPRRVALITGLGYAFTGEARGKRRIIRGIVETLYGRALATADMVIYQNPDDAALFASLGLLPSQGEVKVVDGSGIDLADFPPEPLPEGPITFLMVARLLTAKGICEYADAAALLKPRYPDAQFKLVGPYDSNPDGVGEDTLERWAKIGALDWTGPSDDVQAELAKSHVFVLPSFYREGVPRSSLEALATGRAIVTTDSPGCRETVTPGVNGYLVPPRDAGALAAAMEKLILDPSLVETMGAASLALARDRFDVDKVNADMLDYMGVERQENGR